MQSEDASKRVAAKVLEMPAIATMVILCGGSLFGINARGFAQDATPKTAISFEILSVGNQSALAAQQWGRIFDNLGEMIQIRRPRPGEKPEIRQRMVAGYRRITAIGVLDREGRVVFGDRRFSRTDTTALVNWIGDLKQYGHQGSPDGQPLWGLNDEQFAEVYEALSAPFEADVRGEEFEGGLALTGLPPQYPIVMSRESREWLQSEFTKLPPIRKTVTGFSIGTALAMVLNDYGLGFRPSRQPDGTMHLAVEPLHKTTDVWPVGWEPKANRYNTAPKLFQFVPVELDDVSLRDVVDAVALKTDVPVRYDYYRIEGSGIHIDDLRVTFPAKQMTWSRMLRSATVRNRLSHRLMIDELGQPFVWITNAQSARVLSQ